MFIFHIAYALELIALGVGVGFLVWSMQEKKGAMLAKVFGYIITIISLIILVCSFYSSMKFWSMRSQMMHSMQMQQMQQMHPMMIRPMQQKMMHSQNNTIKNQNTAANTTPAKAPH